MRHRKEAICVSKNWWVPPPGSARDDRVGGHHRSYCPGPKARTEPQREDIGKTLERLAGCVSSVESPPG
ncbi:MAG: hypothetical protein AAF670_02780 [Planctomycetota bacterium]